MTNKFTAKAETVIQAPASRVWDALVNPAMIKQWLFGTEVVTDWKEGSPIIYKGVWEGKPYEDKGTIIKIVPEKLLAATYWSSFSGQPDLAENYNNVTYQLKEDGDETTLTITQDNVPTKESADHSQKNWQMVIEKLKELVE